MLVNSNSQLTKTLLVRSFADFLRIDIAAGDASEDTVKNYLYQIYKYFEWCDRFGVVPAQATEAEIKSYRYWLVHENYKPATIAFKLVAVKRLYAAAVSKKLIPNNPAAGVSSPKEYCDRAEHITYLEQQEVSKLLAAIPNRNDLASLRDRLLVAVMVLQGCRTVEMHRLNLEDVVRRGTNVGLRVKSKRSLRVVPLIPDLAKLLDLYLKAREYPSGNSPMFVSLASATRGARLSRRSIARIVDKYLEAANLKQTPGRTLTAHSLRHTAGTLAFRTGSDLRQVQDLLGHADPRTTAIYIHIGDRWDHNPALKFGVELFEKSPDFR